MATGGEAVLAACVEHNVEQLVFVRHANAAPLPGTAPARKDQPHHWKREDQLRVLTPKGQEQCRVAATWFSTVPVRGFLSSPARRATETAVGMSAASETLAIRMVEGIHPAGMSESCETLFDVMGYGPLRKFFDVEGGEMAFREYGHIACMQIGQELAAVADGGDRSKTCVAIFGHAVFLNAIALEVAVAAKCSNETVASLLDMDLGETQGIMMDLETGSISKRAFVTAGGAAVVAVCKEKGVRQLLLVRHANSAPLAEGVPARKDKRHHWKREDQMRLLTQKGKEQCALASQWFSKLPVGYMLSSPARRAADTAVNMASMVESETCKAGTLPVRMVESVHPAGMNETCEMLFETMGYGPLRNFFEAEGGEEAFRDYANSACADIAAVLSAMGSDCGDCVALFGHAVFLNAIALEVCIAGGWAAETVNQLLDLDLGETHGILVDISTGAISFPAS